MNLWSLFQKKKPEPAPDMLPAQPRPEENGCRHSAGVTAKLDPARLTRRQRESIRRRAGAGERITF